MLTTSKGIPEGERKSKKKRGKKGRDMFNRKILKMSW